MEKSWNFEFSQISLAFLLRKICWLDTLLTHNETDKSLICKIFYMVRVCGGGGGGVVQPPRHLSGTGMLYKVVTDRVAGVVEAVHFYIWLVSKSWNSDKMVMESHGKVMEFYFWISVGTLYTTILIGQNVVLLQRLVDTLGQDEVEVRRRLADMTRKSTVLRVNEKALARRYSALQDVETHLRKVRFFVIPLNFL